MFTSAFRMAMTASFDPRSLAPILWYDGADPATMWDATSGGSLVAANGTIGRWEDKSGNGYHLTQATSGARPTRKAATLNGRDVVGFNGVNEINTAASVAFASTLGVSAFYVFKSTVSTVGIIFETSPNYNLNSALLVISESGNKFFSSHHDASISSPNYSVAQETTGSTSAYHIWSATNGVSLTSGESSFLRDGNARSQTNVGNNADTTAGISSNRVFVGARSGVVGPLTGEIAEILIYTRVLTTAERQAVERYLSAKWAIALA